MALIINDRVKETTTTTGTGAALGTVGGFETFGAGIEIVMTFYCIAHRSLSEFEVGRYTKR